MRLLQGRQRPAGLQQMMINFVYVITQTTGVVVGVRGMTTFWSNEHKFVLLEAGGNECG